MKQEHEDKIRRLARKPFLEGAVDDRETQEPESCKRSVCSWKGCKTEKCHNTRKSSMHRTPSNLGKRFRGVKVYKFSVTGQNTFRYGGSVGNMQSWYSAVLKCTGIDVIYKTPEALPGKQPTNNPPIPKHEAPRQATNKNTNKNQCPPAPPRPQNPGPRTPRSTPEAG